MPLKSTTQHERAKKPDSISKRERAKEPESTKP